MIHDRNLEILDNLLEKTLTGSISWHEEDPDSYSAEFQGRRIEIQFLYVEATNREGADRNLVHLYFPGYSCFFFSGTECYCMVVEILAASFDKWKIHAAHYGEDALVFLNQSGGVD